jgi:hypothetical protein
MSAMWQLLFFEQSGTYSLSFILEIQYLKNILTSSWCVLEKSELASLTADPRLKAVVSINDALMTSAPILRSLISMITKVINYF